jgi:hypothetical protein
VPLKFLEEYPAAELILCSPCSPVEAPAEFQPSVLSRRGIFPAPSSALSPTRRLLLHARSLLSSPSRCFAGRRSSQPWSSIATHLSFSRFPELAPNQTAPGPSPMAGRAQPRRRPQLRTPAWTAPAALHGALAPWSSSNRAPSPRAPSRRPPLSKPSLAAPFLQLPAIAAPSFSLATCAPTLCSLCWLAVPSALARRAPKLLQSRSPAASSSSRRSSCVALSARRAPWHSSWPPRRALRCCPCARACFSVHGRVSLLGLCYSSARSHVLLFGYSSSAALGSPWYSSLSSRRSPSTSLNRPCPTPVMAIVEYRYELPALLLCSRKYQALNNHRFVATCVCATRPMSSSSYF